jgi:hypothetical protein
LKSCAFWRQVQAEWCMQIWIGASLSSCVEAPGSNDGRGQH